MSKSENNSPNISRRDMLRLGGLGLATAACPGLLQAQLQEPATVLPDTPPGVPDSSKTHVVIKAENPALLRDRAKCIRCGQCSDYCYRTNTVQGHRSSEGRLSCIHCGQCSIRCETKSITERSAVSEFLAALDDPKVCVVATTAPSVRASLGEMFRVEYPLSSGVDLKNHSTIVLDPFPLGTNVEREMVTALRMLGCDYVFDATFGADLCVMEEATELLERLKQKPEQPLYTSCCPSWVRFAELFYPQILPNISTTKSPLLMQGAMIKTYFAEKQGIDPKKIFHVALMPCTAKKAEIQRANSNVDLVLTTRELGAVLQAKEIDLAALSAQPPHPNPIPGGARGRNATTYDNLLGRGSGGGLAFGRSGGVMESALRTAYFLHNNEDAPLTKDVEIRGTTQTVNWVNPMPHASRIAGVRTDTVAFGDRELRVAVVETPGSARGLLDAMEHDGERFDFVEVMACPGGCLGGGGQPCPAELDKLQDIIAARKSALQTGIDQCRVRLCHENEDVKRVYEEFLEKPFGEKAKEMLHEVSREPPPTARAEY